MKVDGGCYCGAITFEADIDPEQVRICHCADCQVMSGAPYRANVTVPREKLSLRGTPKNYVKVADSGNRRVQAFCPECGSGVYSCPDQPDPPVYTLRIGTIRQRAQLAPTTQQWCRSAMEWAEDVHDLPRFEKQRPN